MDLLELALNPRLAKQRMSPFTSELPAGQGRKLEYFFGDRGTADLSERVLYSRDAAAPPTTLKMLLKRDAWAVVRPMVRGDLFELIRYANTNGVPIVPRGAGTSGYGGSVPTEGGVVVDMRAFKKILEINVPQQTVTVEGNATFAQVETALRAEGLALRQYPTAFHAGTLAGWYSQGGGGIGSAKYGPFRHDVIEVAIVAPDGKEHRFSGADLDLVSETHGTAGFIVEMKLKVRKATKEVSWLATFDDGAAAAHAAKRLALEAKPYNIIVITPEYGDLVNTAAGSRILPTKNAVLVTLEDDSNAGAIEIIKGVFVTGGGTVAKEADAQKAWDNRFNHLNLKRLGPSVVVAEAAVHVERFGDAMAAAWREQRMGRACIWAIAISPTEMDVIFYGLQDERRGTYPLSTGNAFAVIDAVKSVGGRSYSTGVLAAHESKAVLGADRLKRLRAWRKKTDKRSVFNPGPVLGPRTRAMPLPIADFATQVKMAAPMLKAQRGMFPYPGGDKADPQTLAYGRALGRVHSGALGQLATEVTSCIFCGMCNAYAPEAQDSVWESAMPRGRVELAKAVIEGRANISPRAHRNVARTALEHMPDAVCPTAIPIQRVTDLLLAAAVRENGPLPEHAAIAANVQEHGNVQGKPADARSKWVNVGFDATSTSVFLPDDIACYEAPEIAKMAALALINAGHPLGHMGKQDGTSGATLFETGQREAAAAAILPTLEAMVKRGVATIVTPDANAARVMALDWPLVARENDVAMPDVVHTSTLLAELIKAKRIEFGDNKLDKKVVVHAPEGLTPIQRQAVHDIAKAVGATILDAPHMESGHGRALRELEPALAQRMAEQALKAAVDIGAEAILTMSPGPYVALKTAGKKAKAGIDVLDLHEIVATTMVAKGGAAAAAPIVVEEADEAPKEPEIPADHFRVEFAKEGVVLAVHKNATILGAAEEAGLDLPSSCRAGSCDTCSAKWEGSPPDQSAGEALSADQQKTYVLTCIARPKGPVKIWSDERP